MADESAHRELAVRAQAGDKEALGRLVAMFRPRLCALAASRLAAHSLRHVDVEEIVQETHLRACRAIVRFAWEGEDSFVRWLGGIAEHVIADAARKGARSRGVPLGRDPSADIETASRELRRNERLDRLRRALKQLPPDQRKVVILARLQRLPVRTIAERMGRSPGATSHLLIRAVRKLRALMGDTESLSLPRRHIDPEEFDDDIR